MPLLEISDLKISFKDVRVVDGVSFSVDSRETVGIVGESGSGKTLTALAVMGLLPKEAGLDAGRIRFEGGSVKGKDIAMIFQEPFTSLNPVLTAGAQLDEMLAEHTSLNKKEIKGRTFALLEKVRFKEPGVTYSKYPHQLSGGERQRVMIAMAIAIGPKLLIADEPTTALDVTVQAEILKLIKGLQQEMNMAVLFITHDFGIVGEMADRVIVMKDGKVIETGDSGQILSCPRDPYTRKLIDAVPHMGDNGPALGAEPASLNDDLLIETRSLSKTFTLERGALRSALENVYAVKNVDMRIIRGSTVGLVGESGCGKSTLGRLLLGLEKPDHGEVLINGVAGHGKFSRKICKMLQIVFQDPYSSLDPRMKMGDIVIEGADLLGIPRSEQLDLLRDILSRVRLSVSDMSKYPHQFSGGQRQRIAIARALMVRPEFIVLDEPVSSLDVLIQKDIIDLLKELKTGSGLTYLFISHDLRLVRSIADTVYVMHRGEIVEHGPVMDVYAHPADDYTKRLIASIPELDVPQ